MLEWAVGQVSIAIDAPPLPWPMLARVGTEQLLDMRLTIQPGVRYLRFSWAVDELMTLRMREAEPERFALAQVDAPIEIRGTRGAVALTRLDAKHLRISQRAGGRTCDRCGRRRWRSTSTFRSIPATPCDASSTPVS